MVENQGAGKLKLRAKSLQFSLAKERELFDIPNPKGHPFVLDAGKEDMKATTSRPARQGVTLYWYQLKKKNRPEVYVGVVS